MPQKVDLYDYLRFKKSIPAPSKFPRISNVSITAEGLVTWTTDVASTSQVLYGFVPYLGFESDYDATLVTSHSVQLTNLVDGLYYVRVRSFRTDSATTSDLYTFTFVGVGTNIFLLEDGSSHILLEDGSSKLILEG